jgi:hypothetical protein
VTPAALYERIPERIDTAVEILKGCYYNHVPELEFDILPHEVANSRVQIRYYKEFDFDGRRYWRLASVWYETNDCHWKPFMIIQNAGREGDDHHKRFVTDVGLYAEAVRFLKSICLTPDKGDPEVVSPFDDIEGLTEFYGNRLDGHFERHRY